MQIPMIFFTIIIEKRKKDPNEQYIWHLQQKELDRIEHQRVMQAALLPPYCTRL